MSTTCVGNFFPKTWIYGEYEQNIHANIVDQVNLRFADQNNVVFNTTWHGPKTHEEIDTVIAAGRRIDNLVVISTVDAYLDHLIDPMIAKLANSVGVDNIYRLGNFNGNQYFNFFAIVCKDHHERYSPDELALVDPKHLFISYNRKPYPHRLALVKALIKHNLKDLGVVTLGKPFPGNVDPEDNLYFSIGEKDEDYVKYGHWYPLGTESTPHEIPHDLFSLHNMYYWQHHFLHIVGATENSNNTNTFVHQINFKPLIGMRPFVINGQVKQYKFLRDHGFKTFNHYFPGIDLEVPGDRADGKLTEALIQAIQYLATKSKSELMSMYNDMLPDLLYNRNRWFEWADEQKYKVEHIFE